MDVEGAVPNYKFMCNKPETKFLTGEVKYSQYHECPGSRLGDTVVSRKYAPPFANLVLVQNAGKGGGGIYAGSDNFSRDYALPSGNA